MKKFILTILSVAVFFIGLGSLVEKTGAKFKSDERALAIIAQARQAIGGDEAIKNVRSMTIAGNAAQTFTIDGATRTEQGTLEISLQMPNQFSKMLKIGKESAAGENGTRIEHQTRVFITTKDDDKAVLNSAGADGARKVFIVKKGDGDAVLKDGEVPADGKRVIAREVKIDASHYRQNELFRTTFALLLSAPEGLDASYNYAGVESVDGKSCDVILVESGNSPFKLFIDQSSHLPVMVSYRGAIPLIFNYNKEDVETGEMAKTRNFIVSKDGSQTETGDGKVQIIARRLSPPEADAEYQIKFSDFRSVNGVQLPYRWTQTVGGREDQNVDITIYEINPANITEKFNNDSPVRIMRTKKPQ